MIEFDPKKAAKIEKAVITIRIEEDLLNEIDVPAHNVDISRNEFILQCIGFAMEHYPKFQGEK